jgi:alpha-tubulin suppressor-like RCC1 family protein
LFSDLNIESNKVWVSGYNEHGECGLGEDYEYELVEKPVPLYFFSERNLIIKDFACGWAHTIYLTQNGDCYCCGQRSAIPIFPANPYSKKSVTVFEPRKLPLSNITHICAGSNSSYFIVSM